MLISSHMLLISILILIPIFLMGCQYKPEIPLGKNEAVIKIDQNLQVIAHKNKVTLKSLLDFNNIKPPYDLPLGTIVKIPHKSIPTEDVLTKEERALAEGPLFGIDSIKKKSTHNINDLEVAVVQPVKETEEKIPLPFKQAPVVKEREILIDDTAEDKPIENKPLIEEKFRDETKTEPGKEGEKDKKRDAKRDDIVYIVEKSDKSKTDAQNQTEIPTNKAFIAPIEKFKNVTVGNKKTLKLKPIGNTTVRAIRAGDIITTDKSFPEMGGKIVIIKHEYNNQIFLSVYGGFKHINKDIISKHKQYVEQGDILGTLGDIGSTNSLLHFELRLNQKAIDPRKYISALKAN